MPSNKIQRINEDIRLCISRLLMEVKDPRVRQGMVSVTNVDTTSDLKYCKIYLSVLGLENRREFLRGVKSANGWFRRELSHSLNLRSTPELTFILDDSIEQGSRLIDVMNEVRRRDEERGFAPDEDESGEDA
jgi:ribosome-binding factor A